LQWLVERSKHGNSRSIRGIATTSGTTSTRKVMKTNKSGKERLNLDMHPDIKALVLDLQRRRNADSMSEIIRRAVQVLETLQTEQEKGSVIILRDRDGKETQLLIV
jgi:hypothetical protein